MHRPREAYNLQYKAVIVRIRYMLALTHASIQMYFCAVKYETVKLLLLEAKSQSEGDSQAP